MRVKCDDRDMEGAFPALSADIPNFTCASVRRMLIHLSGSEEYRVLDDEIAPPERLLSTTQAAHALGVHRSSLHLAIKNNVLAPDLVTQGGHYRFSRATLEAYAERIAHAPLTTNADLLTLLPRIITLPDGKERLCRHTFATVERGIPDMTAFVVVESQPNSDRRIRPHITTSLRFPRTILDQFIATYGKQDMTTTHVLATGEPFYCDNVRTQFIPYSGSQLLNRRSPYQAYAILPLSIGDGVFGTLGVCSRIPHAFTPDEKDLLGRAAQSLAIALACHNAVWARQSHAIALTALLKASFDYRGRSARSRSPHMEQADVLLRVFQKETGAEEMFVAGVESRLEPLSEGARRLAERIIGGEPVAAAQWEGEQGSLVGVAIAMPHVDAYPIALGGVWCGALGEDADYAALLYALAGAYALGRGLTLA
jgi:excisionase family DNA binding protein